jgi:phosphatidylglycerophosphate synthase
MVTVVCMLIAFASAGVALIGTNLALAIAGTLFQLNSVLDGVDGELARVKWQFSKLGEKLDTIGDDLSNFSYFGAVTYVAHTRGESTLAMIGGVGLVVWAVYIAFLQWSLRGTGSGDVMVVSQNAAREAEGFWKKTIEGASKLMRRDFFVFLAFVLAVVGHATSILPVVLIGSTSSFVFAIAETVKRLRG